MSDKILIVEDDPVSALLLTEAVTNIGYSPITTESGEQGWDVLLREPTIKIAFIDWMLPGINGPELCRRIKREIKNRYVYTIMVSSKDDKNDLVHGMAAGADDFMSKPLHPGELISRLFAGQRVLMYEQSLKEESDRSDRLLNTLLPGPIVQRLKAGETEISDLIEQCSVMFVDLCEFSSWCMKTEPRQMINDLGELFALFDRKIEEFGAQKIKSIGDAYMIAAGVPDPIPAHAEILAELARSIRHTVLTNFHREDKRNWSVRTGIASGPVIAGVIGSGRSTFDMWGPTVNLAARLESLAPKNSILVDQLTYQKIHKTFRCEPFGIVQPKGFGDQRAWLLL